jgi:RNA polymerase sigma-70 factor, ECF subfamily
LPPEPLIAALRAGDAEAFEDVIMRYGGRLLAVCRHLLGDEEEARDCVQEALLSAFRQIGRFEGRAELGTWLHRIAVNQALMRLRAQASAPEGPIDHLLPRFDDHGGRHEPAWRFEESVEEALGRRQTRALVLAQIALLPEAYRTVLLLRDVEKLTTREVGELLSLGESAVKVRLHRARAALKRLLEPLWQEVNP